MGKEIVDIVYQMKDERVIKHIEVKDCTHCYKITIVDIADGTMTFFLRIPYGKEFHEYVRNCEDKEMQYVKQIIVKELLDKFGTNAFNGSYADFEQHEYCKLERDDLFRLCDFLLYNIQMIK